MRNVKRMTRILGACSSLAFLAACQTTSPAEPLSLSAAPCTPPPVDACVRGEDCGALVIQQGPAVNPDTGRNYYLDYSCDLNKGEKVNLVLNLHGAGSYGNWQRHYFPLKDYAEDYNLVIATPNAPPQRWAEVDDAHLEGIVSSLIEEIGAGNINSLWLAGHSQGGITSRRIICSDYFADKADGLLSLSGGRVGRSELSPDFYKPGYEDLMRRTTPYPPEVIPQCDFSHIYTTGELEIADLPETSLWADKYHCDARLEREVIIDTEPGYVYDAPSQAKPNPVWGLLPRGGEAEVFVYPNCDDDRVIADIVRLDKGHTEGLEPEVTERIVQLMTSIRNGRIAASAR